MIMSSILWLTVSESRLSETQLIDTKLRGTKRLLMNQIQTRNMKELSVLAHACSSSTREVEA